MRVGVIYGGLSREREISLRTGTAVCAAVTALGHELVDLKVGENLVTAISTARMDVAFIALHGRYGEDGTVQGLLELLKIPYTGSSYIASAVGMDKILTKKLWRHEGIVTPDFQVLRSRSDRCVIDYPFVVKPPREGSTIGISIVSGDSEYDRAVDQAFGMDSEVLLESFVKGREMTVAVFEDEVFTPIEIIPRTGHYDYHSKYTQGATEYVIPPDCSRNVLDGMMTTALKAYRTINCNGAARVDFILDSSDVPYALEINTIPGMTETSLLPKAAAYHGISFTGLVDRIIRSAGLYSSGTKA